MANLLKLEKYDPVALLDLVMMRLKVRNDAALARHLGVSAPIICRMRKRTVKIHADLLVRMHDATGISLDELRLIGGIPKTRLEIPKTNLEMVEEEA